MDQANELRGEVDLELDGQSFVLRPSYEAILAVEQQTGQSLLELAMAADDGRMKMAAAAIVVTECVKAWGRATENPGAAGVNAKRIGELLFDYGLMAVLPRIALVLSRAATGGVTASGEMKASTTTMTAILADALQASPLPPSDGAPPTSGKAPATNSGRRSKRGSK